MARQTTSRHDDDQHGALALIQRLPPRDTHVVVEGGHFTLRRRRPRHGHDMSGIYYLKVQTGAPRSPFEQYRTGVQGTSGLSWAVLDIPRGERIPNEDSLLRFDDPTPTEIRSLRTAIQLYKFLKERVRQVTLTLLVGDLYIPPELRRSGMRILPSQYKALLSELDDSDVRLLGEAFCQNHGDRKILDKAKKLLDPVVGGREYQKSGFGIFLGRGVPDGQTLFLTADYLFTKARERIPFIALTKYNVKPSCAVTIAGKLSRLSSWGANHHIAIHDRFDDPDIHQKLTDGAIAAGYFMPSMVMTSQFITTLDGHHPNVDYIDPATIRAGGRLNYIDFMNLAIEEGNEHCNLQVADALAVDACCPFSPPRLSQSTAIGEE